MDNAGVRVTDDFITVRQFHDQISLARFLCGQAKLPGLVERIYKPVDPVNSGFIIHSGTSCGSFFRLCLDVLASGYGFFKNLTVSQCEERI